MNQHLTGSKLDLAETCAPSMVFPWVQEDGEAAAVGTSVHGTIASMTGGKTLDDALLLIPEEHRAAAKARIHERLPVDVINGVAEMSVALDPFTGACRLLGQNLGRRYPALQPDEIALTLDWYGLLEMGLLILDWKSGRTKQKPASEALQLGAAAFALTTIHKRPSATVGFVFLPEDGEVSVDKADLDAFALDDVRERLKKVVGNVARAEELVRQGKQPDLHRGPWCRYCPAYEACPAQVGLVRHIVSPEGALELAGMAAIDPARMPEVYRRMREVEALIAKVKEQIHHYALVHPIPVADGMVYGPVESSRESVDGNIVYPTLREKYGQAVADLACSMESSKTAIKAAAKKVAEALSSKVAPVEKEMLDAIRMAGGISTKVSVVVREHK